MNCNCCGNPIHSDDHIYNIHCAASNAEYDQILAEIAEAQKEPMEEDLSERLHEIGREVIAYVIFKMNLRGF